MFMSYDVYFANWKQTKTEALLRKISALLIGALTCFLRRNQSSQSARKFW